MKEKIKNSCSSFFKSIFNNRELFERRNYSSFFPFVIFLLIISMMILPSYIAATNLDSDMVMKNFPKINAPVEKLLTSSLDCHVTDGTLVCSEDAIEINTIVGEDIEYTLVANQDSFSINTAVSYEEPKKTDNIIILLKNYIKIRYCERDHVNKKVISYEVIGNYSKFEGYNFKEISDKISNDPSLLENEISNFVYNTYSSTLKTQTIAKLSSSLFSLTLFILISSLILKWPTLLKLNKGFKFSQCLKISITASAPALIFATIIYFLFGIEFFLSFALIYVVRILFIYFKYFFTTKNDIFAAIYNKTHEERFNLK